MTCTINSQRYPTKKVLRLQVAFDPMYVTIHDPTLNKERSFAADSIKNGEEVLVTNHPNRTWFAKIGRDAAGALYVK